MPKGIFKHSFIPPSTRMWNYVDKNGPIIRPELGPCWLWIGKCKCRDGRYGAIRDYQKNKFYAVHRLSYEFHYGAIAEDMFVLHKCDTPLCVRPDHLFLGTQTDNMKDCLLKNRHAKGKRLPQTILTEEQVRFIKHSGLNGPKLAKQFGVHEQTIYSIKSGHNWKWII